MCPSRQHLQVFLLAFCNDFDLAAAQIAYPSGNCKFFGLIVRRESKADSLHPSVDDQMQTGAPRFVLSRHDSDLAPVKLRETLAEGFGFRHRLTMFPQVPTPTLSRRAPALPNPAPSSTSIPAPRPRRRNPFCGSPTT